MLLRWRRTTTEGTVDSRGPTGENAVGMSGVTFHTGANGAVDSVTVENLDTTGLGTFTR